VTDPEAVVLTALATIAPEADFAAFDRDADLQEELDLDSMDFLNFLIAVAQETGIEIPESEYAQVRSFSGCVAYLRDHAASA
jgi:acyl carrier protein